MAKKTRTVNPKPFVPKGAVTKNPKRRYGCGGKTKTK